MDSVIGKLCPYCQFPIKAKDNVVFCSACGIPHHRECWEENGSCTTFGCQGTMSLSPAVAEAAATVVDIDLDSVPETKICPYCGETILSAAIRCRFCQSDLTSTPSGLGDTETIFSGRNTGTVISAGIFPKASTWKRFWAYMLDGLVASAAALPFTIAIIVYVELESMYYNDNGSWIFVLLTLPFVVWSVYYSFTKDGRENGQSIGKGALGLMVVSLDTGQPCTKGKSALRQLIWLVGAIPTIGWLIYPIECIMVLADDRSRRTGDHIANTQVIALSDYQSSLRGGGGFN